MIAGHLQEKKGYFYAVLNYKDANNKRKTKWFPTGYPVTESNRSKAQSFLKKQQKTFVIPTEEETSARKKSKEHRVHNMRPSIIGLEFVFCKRLYI